MVKIAYFKRENTRIQMKKKMTKEISLQNIKYKNKTNNNAQQYYAVIK